MTEQPIPMSVWEEGFSAVRAELEAEIERLREQLRFQGRLIGAVDHSYLLAALDRCEHGRHSRDSCLSCPGGHSTGNLFLEPGQRIGTTLYAEPIVVPSEMNNRGNVSQEPLELEAIAELIPVAMVEATAPIILRALVPGTQWDDTSSFNRAWARDIAALSIAAAVTAPVSDVQSDGVSDQFGTFIQLRRAIRRELIKAAEKAGEAPPPDPVVHFDRSQIGQTVASVTLYLGSGIAERVVVAPAGTGDLGAALQLVRELARQLEKRDYSVKEM